MTRSLEPGRYTSGKFSLDLVHVGARSLDFRVQDPEHAFLTAYLDAIEPEELFGPTEATAQRQKHALPALPAFTGSPRKGWLLDAREVRTCTIWSEENDRAVKSDGRQLRLALELYTQAALEPWEGLLSAAPGASLDGKAPAWVDKLRIAHIALLGALKDLGIAPMVLTQDATPSSISVGSYTDGERKAQLRLVSEQMRVVVDDPVLTSFLGDLSGQAIAAASRAGRWGETIECGEPEWTLAPFGKSVALVAEDGRTTDLTQPELLAYLSLNAAATLAPYAGQRVGGSVPEWVGSLRRTHAQLGGLMTSTWAKEPTPAQ